MMLNRLHGMISLVLIIMFLISCFPRSVISAASPTEKHVLILHAFTPDYPAHDLYNKGLKSKLAQNSTYTFSYSYEYLDLVRHPNDAGYFKNIAQYLQLKYANHQPDFIITSSDLYSLLLKYGKDLFPDVPVIIAWNEDKLPLTTMPANYVVIPLSIDIDRNIQLILQTRPLTKKIYLVFGDSESERNIARKLSEIQDKYTDQVELVYMNKLPYAQLLERLRRAEDHSTILYFQWFSDVDGKSYIPTQVIQTICKEVNIPVYGTAIQYFGTGIMGGYVNNFEIVGQNAAHAVLDISAGKKPADHPVIRAASSTLMFDWRELKRWGIDEHKLPSGSKIEYKETSVWELYGDYMIGGMVLLVLQALLIFGLLINTRRRKRAENELLQVNHSLQMMTEKLISLDKMKDEFLVNTSHELQTPLNGIINISEMLAEGNYGSVNQKQKEELQIILAVSRRLSSLIRDIIDVEKIKRNEIQLHFAPIDIESVSAVVVDVFRHFIQSKNIQISMNISEGLSPAFADEKRLSQVLYNLIGNAVKFTESGTVTLSARDGDKFVKIMIEDTGIGISKEKQKKLFNTFTQGGTEISSQYGGSGLGLYISRQLLERMNGHIFLEWSEPEKGTCFSLLLPKADEKPINRDKTVERIPEEAPPAVKSKNKLIQHGKILAVDDEPTNLRVLKSLLAGDGYEVLTASNGLEALKVIKEQHDIDLVLMDVMMPRMSGYEACRKMREDYSLYDLPLLILTVRDTPEDIAAGFDAGANDFVTKPFVAKELRARVSTLLQMKKSVQEALKNEMAFLQSQIKPHFLFNTMSTIMSFCYTDGARAGDLLAYLSEYLQKSFTIDHTASTVSLENELDLTNAYVEIEKARFGERLTVEYDIDHVLIEQRILPLTIQPLVENSIRHGLMKRKAGGIVKIIVKKEKGGIRISVEDNGIGMEDVDFVFKSKDLLKRQQGGVGLANIKRRLMKYYGTELYLYSKINEGTKVYFTIPLQENNVK